MKLSATRLLLALALACLDGSLARAEQTQPPGTAPSPEIVNDAGAEEEQPIMTVLAVIGPRPRDYAYVIHSASQILGAVVVEDGEEAGTITDLTFDADGRLQDATVEQWNETGDSTMRSIPIADFAFREVPHWTDPFDPPPMETGPSGNENTGPAN